jgi:hypothetical protein
VLQHRSTATFGVALAAAGALVATTLGGTSVSALDAQRAADRAAFLAAPTTPQLTSENVEHVGNVPDTAAISIAFADSAPFFYVSSLDTIQVFSYDPEDPADVTPHGVLPMGQFQNEAMAYGERTIDGELRRFVLVGNDLFNVTTGAGGRPTDGSGFEDSDLEIGRFGGRELLVVDVTDPDAPVVAGRADTTTSTHTVQCIDPECTVAYSSGNRGLTSIVDLSDPTNPEEVGTIDTPAAKSDFPAGHYWDADNVNDIAWHTGGGGIAAFDISDPLAPVLLNSTDPDGNSRINDNEFDNPNDFILHDSIRPNGAAFAGDPGAEPSLAAGNVVVATEEDYLNDGEELICERAGAITTWHVPTLEEGDNPTGEAGDGSMSVLDVFNPTTDSEAPVPAAAFCSAHWLDYHPEEIVAQGYYQGGLRLIDLSDPENLTEYGFAVGGLSEVWAAYWVPERDDDGVIVEGAKTDVVYTADLVRGVDVFQVDLPSSSEAPTEEPPTEEPPTEQPGNGNPGNGGGDGGGNGGGNAGGGNGNGKQTSTGGSVRSARGVPAGAVTAPSTRPAGATLAATGTELPGGVLLLSAGLVGAALGLRRWLLTER